MVTSKPWLQPLHPKHFCCEKRKHLLWVVRWCLRWILKIKQWVPKSFCSPGFKCLPWYTFYAGFLPCSSNLDMYSHYMCVNLGSKVIKNKPKNETSHHHHPRNSSKNLLPAQHKESEVTHLIRCVIVNTVNSLIRAINLHISH